MVSTGLKTEKWIIDTDPGCDDLMAILYLVNRPEVEIEFISLAEGNCKMVDVLRNIKKIYKMSGKSFPVYSGCEQQLYHGAKNAYDYHFEDGLGNIDSIKELDVSDIQITGKRASVEIVKTINKYPGQVNILCLAPLTNLSVAYMLDPSIAGKFKNVVVMGGSYQWRGNVTSTGEFNFYHDFLSAQIFLKNFKNLLVTGWEPTEFLFFNVLNLEESKHIAISKFGGYNEYLYSFLHLIIEKYTRKRQGTQICDLYAIIALFNLESVTKFFMAKSEIIIDSDELRGTLIFNHKHYPEISYKDLLQEYYLKGTEYKPNYNIFVEEFSLHKIIEEFAYVLRPILSK